MEKQILPACRTPRRITDEMTFGVCVYPLEVVGLARPAFSGIASRRLVCMRERHGTPVLPALQLDCAICRGEARSKMIEPQA